MVKRRRKNLIAVNNMGTTLIEMLVCFMMLAIFLTAAFSVITHLSKLYYQVKGETYGKQVSDILLTKIQSEIEGAKSGSDEILINGSATNSSGTKMTFYDRTNTKIDLYSEDSLLKIKYHSFTDEVTGVNKNENTWKFDKNVYNGFEVKNLQFLKAANLGKAGNESATSLAQSYGVSVSEGDYGNDVMLVLLELDSHHYGTYKSYRFIKMYNVDPNPSGGGTNP